MIFLSLTIICGLGGLIGYGVAIGNQKLIAIAFLLEALLILKTGFEHED